MHNDPDHRFDRASADYDGVRPGYTREAVRWLCERAAVAEGDPCLDLGAGTGLLSKRLADSGLELIAAEPNDRMRMVLAERLPDARLLGDRAERLSLADGSVALVTAAQAFHWFEQPAALLEIQRVLQPGGCFAVVWIRAEEHPLSDRIEELSFSLLRSQGVAPGPMPGEPLGWEGQFEPLERGEFPFRWSLEPGALARYVGSFSVIANLPEAERREVLAEVSGWPESGAGVELPYRVEINLARALPAPGPGSDRAAI